MSLGLMFTAVRTSVLAILRANIQLTTYVGTRVYPDSNGDAPEKPSYPYVQVEYESETTEDMMGDASDVNGGAQVRFNLRVATQTRSDTQGKSIGNIISLALHRQLLTISGASYAFCEHPESEQKSTLLIDSQGGIVTREELLRFMVTVSQ